MSTILIVDDQYANRLLVRTLLLHAGHVAVEAASATQALELAAQWRPDLVLVDLSLPGMSGTELVRVLRTQKETSGLAIALYTGSSAYPALRDFMELYGIRRLIPKPADPQTILQAIETALRD